MKAPFSKCAHGHTDRCTDAQQHNAMAPMHITLMHKQNFVPSSYPDLCLDESMEQISPYLNQNAPICLMLRPMNVYNLS